MFLNKIYLIITITLLFATSYATDKTEWTYLFYLSDESQSSNYNEICSGSPLLKNSNIVVLYGKQSDRAYAYLVKDCKNKDEISISSNNSSNHETLAEIIKTTKNKYPSKRLMLTIIGEFNGDEIAQAAGRADVIAVDQSYFGSIENLYALRSSADYVSAISTKAPEKRNNYKTFMEILSKLNDTSSFARAESFVKSYEKTYKGSKIALSVFTAEMSEKIEALTKLIDRRASCFPKKIDRFKKIEPKEPLSENNQGRNIDMLSSLEVINRVFTKKSEPIIVSRFSNKTSFDGPAMFFPLDKAVFDKEIEKYSESVFGRNHKEWVKFLEKYYKELR
jgi:hypothetical protein